jgi:hypothetical protein
MGGYLERLKEKKCQGEVLPKLPKVKKDENMPTGGTAKTAKRAFDSKDSGWGGHISETMPSPSPAGMGPEYERIWNQAWKLAEWIDDQSAAPIEERRARLPELNKLRARMAEIEKAGAQIPAGLDPEPLTAGAWIKWESNTTTTRDRTPDTGMIKHPAIVREQ